MYAKQYFYRNTFMIYYEQIIHLKACLLHTMSFKNVKKMIRIVNREKTQGQILYIYKSL